MGIKFCPDMLILAMKLNHFYAVESYFRQLWQKKHMLKFVNNACKSKVLGFIPLQQDTGLNKGLRPLPLVRTRLAVTITLITTTI